MSEFINSYVNRQFQKYDANRNGLIAAAPLTIGPIQIGGQTEVTGRVADYFARNTAFGVGQLDPYSLQNAVARDVDSNHDGQVDLLERVVGWFKTGMW